MRKKIYIAYTGGTIGMQKSNSGYIPTPGFITEQMAYMTELQNESMPIYTIHEYATPIDSSNMTPQQWRLIADDITAHYSEYDGFIILHGTDTMAYTASALSFMLENLAKPVILTGSQLPLSEIRNDARATLITTLLLANQLDIPEVSLYFGNKLLRGNRARKLSTENFDTFDSLNFPPLAIAERNISTKKELWLRPSKRPLQVQNIREDLVACLRLFPGMSMTVLKQLLAAPLKGLIIETFGSGNAPDNNPIFIELLKTAIANGTIIVNCTQCPHGRVDMAQYATGRLLFDIGVISAYDMTPEATLTKLLYLFSKDLPIEIIKQQMQKNLQGELSLS
jgi:L-asparaginase